MYVQFPANNQVFYLVVSSHWKWDVYLFICRKVCNTICGVFLCDKIFIFSFQRLPPHHWQSEVRNCAKERAAWELSLLSCHQKASWTVFSHEQLVNPNPTKTCFSVSELESSSTIVASVKHANCLEGDMVLFGGIWVSGMPGRSVCERFFYRASASETNVSVLACVKCRHPQLWFSHIACAGERDILIGLHGESDRAEGRWGDGERLWNKKCREKLWFR